MCSMTARQSQMLRDPESSQVRPTVTVAIPTLAADETLTACLAALERQTLRGVEVIVVDNSGRRAVQPHAQVRIISNERNVGFGVAINQAFRQSAAPFLAVLND